MNIATVMLKAGFKNNLLKTAKKIKWKKVSASPKSLVGEFQC